ncbi:hypothetical protein ACFP4H_09410 [Pseudophaeobacter arcticus]|uniref:hypothetical protein n=1 Tax=Pseudophaeobacter arcticus TaxID=385492 RepID=UPI0004011550|nr:hypothetical protein [Pseudophaeobacter arcticus]
MKTAEKIDDFTLCIHLKATLLDSVLTPQPDMEVPDTHPGIAFAPPIAPPSRAVISIHAVQRQAADARRPPQ